MLDSEMHRRLVGNDVGIFFFLEEVFPFERK